MATRVLIAGGRVAALEAALALRALAGERVSVELLAPEPHFWYRPLSVAEPYEGVHARRFELAELAAAAAGAPFAPGASIGWTPDAISPGSRLVVSIAACRLRRRFLAQGVRVQLVDGSYQTVDSSEMAFKIAGSLAFKAAYEKANPVLLKPIMEIEVNVPPTPPAP